jgi:hypothetical protein
MKKLVRSLIWVVLLGLTLPVLSACNYERDDETITPKTTQPASSKVDPKNLPSFYIDSVNRGQYRTGFVVRVTPDRAEIPVQGWAVDPKHKKPATAVYVVVDGKAEFQASYGEERPDVAAFFNEDNYVETGFTAKVPTAGLTKGKHILTFKVGSPDNTYSVPNWKVEVDLQ